MAEPDVQVVDDEIRSLQAKLSLLWDRVTELRDRIDYQASRIDALEATGKRVVL